MKCHYCNKTTDLRPYGPRGAMVCFGCAMSTPERKAETEQAFAAQLDASGPTAVIDGTEVGPYPTEHHPAAAEAMRCFGAWSHPPEVTMTKQSPGIGGKGGADHG